MTIVKGQIEPLKKLREVLDQNGITRFNTITEINEFLKGYDSERNAIPKNITSALDMEIKGLETGLAKCKKTYEESKEDSTNEINNEIKSLTVKLEQAIEKRNKNIFNKILFYLHVKALARKKSKLENNIDKIIHKKVRFAEKDVIKAKDKLSYIIENKDKIISDRCAKSYKELDDTKEVIDGLYALIAGAVGENSVVKELQRLSDEYYLLNDFSIKFNPPIFNRKENDKIFSIQIDHLLICNSGVYILETKNWSKKSIASYDLRSPVKQIMRTSYALFVLLDSDSKYSDIKLDRHHWGSKKIPIRNLIVMINGKPKEEFKHVKVLSLNELNGYLTYFEPIFSDEEVKRIYQNLSMKNH